MRGHVVAAVTFVHLLLVRNRFVPIEDVLVQPLLPVGHIATARIVTLVMRTRVRRKSVGHVLNVEHHEIFSRPNHPVMIFAVPSTSVERVECFVTLITLELITTVSFFVSLEGLLILVSLRADVTFVIPFVNCHMTAEGVRPGSFKVTLLTRMNLWGSFLTFDDVIPV